MVLDNAEKVARWVWRRRQRWLRLWRLRAGTPPNPGHVVRLITDWQAGGIVLLVAALALAAITIAIW